MPLTTPQGIVVPFPERLTEGYEVITRKAGGYHLRINIDGARLSDIFIELVQLIPEPGFLILESPCNQVRELELRKSESDPFHRDVYYLDGLERYQFMQIFEEYSDLLVHDGYINFGFGSHNTDHKDEIFVGAYKITSIFTDDITDYESAFKRLAIPRCEKLTTAWDTFSDERPGVRMAWSRGHFDIYEMIEILLREKGLYHAKTIVD
ncbi:MAG: hypothetical protein ABIS50_16555 [Luteolibacter sp.]|uniref:hypothetical protein n=1 Tax=Luteolibacter sp. TaxID=1962973 RepID=UPI0032663FD1